MVMSCYIVSYITCMLYFLCEIITVIKNDKFIYCCYIAIIMSRLADWGHDDKHNNNNSNNNNNSKYSSNSSNTSIVYHLAGWDSSAGRPKAGVARLRLKIT